jgi:hypothetical protein
MKNYGAMRFVAGLMQILGWLTVLLGILVFIISAGGERNAYGNSGAVGVIAFLIGGAIALTGMFTVAAGQLISAMADMATNSWYLRGIAENSVKTVSFFERVSGGRAQP